VRDTRERGVDHERVRGADLGGAPFEVARRGEPLDELVVGVAATDDEDERGQR